MDVAWTLQTEYEFQNWIFDFWDVPPLSAKASRASIERGTMHQTKVNLLNFGFLSTILKL